MKAIEAIKIIKGLIVSVELAYKSSPMTDKEAHPAIDALNLAISALKKQEEDRWISVTERLPKEKITALTLKKTKITLDSGRVIEAKKYFDGYRTNLYKYDLSMPKETEVAQSFRSILQDSKQIQGIRFSGLGDEEMIEVASKMRDILELANKENKR